MISQTGHLYKEQKPALGLQPPHMWHQRPLVDQARAAGAAPGILALAVLHPRGPPRLPAWGSLTPRQPRTKRRQPKKRLQ